MGELFPLMQSITLSSLVSYDSSNAITPISLRTQP